MLRRLDAVPLKVTIVGYQVFVGSAAVDNWFVKSLGDAMLAFDAQDGVESHCSAAWRSQGGSDEVAVFVRHESDGRLHCEVKVYFSPAAGSIAKALDAVSCAQPSVHGLALLVGSDAAWNVLFPEGE